MGRGDRGVDAELVEERHRRMRRARIDALGQLLRAEQIHATGAFLRDAGRRAQQAGLSPQADAELARVSAFPEQPAGAGLGDEEIVAVELHRIEPGSDVARQVPSYAPTLR